MSKKKSYSAFSWLLIVTLLNCPLYFPLSAQAENDNSTEQNTVIAETVPIWNDNPFSDVRYSDWFLEDVEYVMQKQLMKGTSNTHFSPKQETTRGMIVTILWRLEGEPNSINKQNFSDIKNDVYYQDAVSWAAENEIVNGYNSKTFGGDDPVTREQLATILYRYASFKKYDITKKSQLLDYKDEKEISDYASIAFQWAHANEVLLGTTKSSLSPKEYASRCQVAVVFKRFCTHFDVYGESIKTKTEISSPDRAEVNINSKPGIQTSDGNSYENQYEKIDSPYIVIGSATGAPGETVELPISIENNPGILGMILSVYYDETVCRLVNVKNGTAVDGVLELTTSKLLNSGVRFVWDGVDIDLDDVKEGSILSMEFTIDNDADGGKYPVTFAFSEGDIVDKNLKSIFPKTENGYITVKKSNQR